MLYRVVTTAKFDKQIRKLNKTVALRITDWLKDNVDSAANPRIHGKPLVGKLNGLWSYRIGVYRVLAVIQDDELLVLCITVEHRRSVYR
jgi:mRNA interferase RelE/StbE